MKTIHTSSGSQLIYEKLGKERKMHDTPPNTVIEDIEQNLHSLGIKNPNERMKHEERMELPKALQSEQERVAQEQQKYYEKQRLAMEDKNSLQVKVQSIHELETINFVKYMGIEIGRMCDKIDQMHDIDKRWLAIGKTNLQQGLMAITRAITKSETF